MIASYVGSQNVRTVVELSMSDLKRVICETMREERVRMAEESKRQRDMDILNRSEVSKLLNVSFATLYRWEKIGYLTPVRAGRKVFYLKNDVMQLVSKATPA